MECVLRSWLPSPASVSPRSPNSQPLLHQSSDAGHLERALASALVAGGPEAPVKPLLSLTPVCAHRITVLCEGKQPSLVLGIEPRPNKAMQVAHC